jgi:hypothetical protein
MTTKACKKSGRKHTPITSEAQQGAMGIAYAAKKGKVSASKLGGPAKEMFKSMPQAELKRHLVESKGKELPQKVSAQAKFEKMRMKQGAKHH